MTQPPVPGAPLPPQQPGAPSADAPLPTQYAQQPAPFPGQSGFVPGGYYVPQPRRVAVPVPAGPLAYHRLAFKRQHPQWWAPLVTGVLVFGFVIAVTVVALVAILVPMSMSGSATSVETPDVLSELVMFDANAPGMFVLLMLSVIIMLPAALGASRIVQGKGLGYLTSVTGKMRWGWLGTTLLIATAFYIVLQGLSFIGQPFPGDGFVAAVQHKNFLLMIVLILVLVPLQCAAEEYVFRGVMMQAIGRWLKNPWWAILLPAPLFMMAHMYDIWGQLSVGFMAVVAGYLTWRTGGLEAAIALHVMNNVSIFLLEAFGLIDSSSSESAGTIGFLAMVVMETAYAAVVVWFAKRKGIERVSPAII